MALERMAALSSLMYSPSDWTTSIRVNCLLSSSAHFGQLSIQYVERSDARHTLRRQLNNVLCFLFVLFNSKQVLPYGRHVEMIERCCRYLVHIQIISSDGYGLTSMFRVSLPNVRYLILSLSPTASLSLKAIARLATPPGNPNHNLPSMATQADAPASCKVVLAGTVAKSLLAEIAEGLRQLDKVPLLVGFLANTDPAARMYADWTARTCKEK